jgi:hypothetical protein
MADEQTPSRYAVPLTDLEAGAHVPAEQQVASQQVDPPGTGPLSAEELDRQRLLGVLGDGRLRIG